MAYVPTSGNPCSLATTTDGGATWKNAAFVPGVLAFPASLTNPGIQFDSCRTPSITYGPGGTLFYLFEADASFNSGNVFITASPDGGATWLPPQQVDVNARLPSDPSGGDFDYQPLVTTDLTFGAGRGNVYIAFGQYQPSNNFTFGQERVIACKAAQLNSYLAGGALHCGSPVLVSSLSTRHLLTANPAVGSDGRVYIAWTDDDETAPSGDFGGPVSFKVASSTDGGATFSAPVVADRLASICPGFTCPGPANGAPSSEFNLPSLAAGPNAGDVYLAVSGPRGTASRVTVSVSHDGGGTWGMRQIVGVIASQGADEQHSPNLAVAPGGRIDLSWYDVTEAGVQNVYLSSSVDGGDSFGPAIKISDTQSDENILGPNTSDSSIGSTATDSGFAVAWADSRRGTIDSGKSDIVFATTIAATPPPTLPQTLAQTGGRVGGHRESFAGAAAVLAAVASACGVAVGRRRRARRRPV